MTDEQIQKIANQALTSINERLNAIRSNISKTWSSTTSENFDDSYKTSIDAINEIYNEINTYNATMELLETYKQNEEKIKELEQLIANEKANPSKAVEYTYTDEYGKLQKGVKYVIDTDKINGWQAEINNLTTENATLKANIISQLETIVPNNLQPKNNSNIAHRGHHPGGIWENSREAFIKAGEVGFWGAEADVLFDSNGKIVVSHGLSDINSKTITIEEYLDICKDYGMTAIIDLKYDSNKNSDAYKNLGPSVVKIIEEKGMLDSCVIQTNHDNDVPNIRAQSEDVRIWYLGYDVVTEQQINLSLENNVECINFNDRNETMTEDNIEKINNAGIDACVWNVWSESKKEQYKQYGAKYIMSDEALGTTPYQEGEEDFNQIVN